MLELEEFRMKLYSAHNHRAWTFLKYGMLLSFLTLALSAGLAACGKKSGDNADATLTVGSLNSDGLAVTSNTTLGGYPVSLVIQGLDPVAATNINQQCGYNSNGAWVCGTNSCYTNQYNQYVCGINNNTSLYSRLNFTVSINGQQQVLQTYLQVQNGSYAQRGQANIGGFQVFYQAACYTADCADFFLEVVVGSGADYRQIGIRKSLVQNKIVKLGEWSAGWNTLRTLQQLMSEI